MIDGQRHTLEAENIEKGQIGKFSKQAIESSYPEPPKGGILKYLKPIVKPITKNTQTDISESVDESIMAQRNEEIITAVSDSEDEIAKLREDAEFRMSSAKKGDESACSGYRYKKESIRSEK